MRLGDRITDELTLRLAITQRPEGTTAMAYDDTGRPHFNNCIQLWPSKGALVCWLQILRPHTVTRRFCATCGRFDIHP